jgi:serine/threonine protein phosphatase PrpC
LPYDAFDAEHEIQDNDILILASDGVFDNLYDEDVEACVLGAAKDVSPADLILSEEAL